MYRVNKIASMPWNVYFVSDIWNGNKFSENKDNKGQIKTLDRDWAKY